MEMKTRLEPTQGITIARSIFIDIPIFKSLQGSAL